MTSATPQFRAETDDTGRFVRQQSRFRDWVRADGSTPFAPAAGRYHLYVSLACPWACRTLVVRSLKGLEDVIGVTVVDPLRDERGWRFLPDEPDPINGFTYLSEAYLATDPSFAGRVTVPTLWDIETGRVVSNESADIVRMLNAEFDGVGGDPSVDLYPEALRAEIDAVNDRVYPDINNGVYQAGFASSQSAYEEAFDRVFAALDWAEARLRDQRFLVGDRVTEADWRLFTTLVRFDPVYVGHFKCNLRRIADYPNLANYTRDLYQRPGIPETVDLDHIKRHYYMTHGQINPTGIVPKGPEIDYASPHDRDRLPEAR
jgi:glutathionyl-hydroquinone reductase